MSFLKALGKPFMMLFLVSCLSLSAWAQGTVKGTVVDENGEPVVGATVRVNGTQAGSITDLNGAFINMVSVDVQEYARSHFEKSVRKTLTIPAWLNAVAQEKKINFSQTLQEALIAKIRA